MAPVTVFDARGSRRRASGPSRQCNGKRATVERSPRHAPLSRSGGAATTTFYTIGHSTRPLADFVALLEHSRVELLVDVRTVPRSRTNPQYDRDALARGLSEARIGYEALPALGGLRGRQRDVAPATNAFWDNESFHNYADYAMSAGFREGLARLRALGAERRCAIMCAEAVWWRCHRRIIADYLLHEGEAVFHIVSENRVEPARMTPAAKPGLPGTLVYPEL